MGNEMKLSNNTSLIRAVRHWTLDYNGVRLVGLGLGSSSYQHIIEWIIYVQYLLTDFRARVPLPLTDTPF